MTRPPDTITNGAEIESADDSQIDHESKNQIPKCFHFDELLMVIAVIAILAALLLAVIGGVKAKTHRTTCLNNLRQINLGLRMYSDDSNDKAPRTPGIISAPALNWSGYKNLMKSYVGLNGASSPRDKLFACPADTFTTTWGAAASDM